MLGVALLVAESFVPSFGILGIGGLTAMLLGSIFLLDQTQTDLRVSLPVIISAVATTGLIALVVGRLIYRSFYIPPRSFQSNLVGHVAEVRERIPAGGMGRVLVNGELWKATADTPLKVGTQVMVERAEGLVLSVGTLKAETPAGAGEPESAS